MLRLRLLQHFLNHSDPAMDKRRPVDALCEQLEKLKPGTLAKVEHPFRVIKTSSDIARCVVATWLGTPASGW